MLRPGFVYLDHNATTRPQASLLTELSSVLVRDQWPWGNPSSVHWASREPKNILRESRKLFSEKFNCHPTEVIFNSGASEGNNTVLKSVWSILGETKNEFLVSHVEHPSVIKTMHYLESLGAIVKWIPVNREGQIDLDFIHKNISDRTALVSVMFANNETGTLFPVLEISKIAKKYNTLMHVDCVQALGKEKIDLKSLGIDYATFSAHKFYGLKGCGVLFVRKSAPYINLIHGGGQERGRRGGTENILSLWSLQKMLPELDNIEKNNETVKNLRDYFEEQIQTRVHGVSITAQKSKRLVNTSSLVISGVDGETLLMSLDLKGYAVSTGAACSSGSPEPSPVLLAMGLTREEAQSSLRVSLGWGNTQVEINNFLDVLVEVIERIRSISESDKVAHV